MLAALLLVPMVHEAVSFLSSSGRIIEECCDAINDCGDIWVETAQELVVPHFNGVIRMPREYHVHARSKAYGIFLTSGS